jgi:hypothetical protein
MSGFLLPRVSKPTTRAVVALLAAAPVTPAPIQPPREWKQAHAEEKASPDGATATVVVAGLGLLSTLGAAFMVERFSRSRERRSQLVAWNAALFERYEAPYRHFLFSWGGSTDADILTKTFEQLQGEAIVPPRLVAKYRETLAALAQTNDPQKRRELAAAFYEAMATVPTRPTGFAEDSDSR